MKEKSANKTVWRKCQTCKRMVRVLIPDMGEPFMRYHLNMGKRCDGSLIGVKINANKKTRRGSRPSAGQINTSLRG